jgi:hypothetical protein
MMVYTAHPRPEQPAAAVIVAEDPKTARLIAQKVLGKRHHIEPLGVGTYRITKRQCWRVR